MAYTCPASSTLHCHSGQRPVKVRWLRSPPVSIWFQLVLGSVLVLFILGISLSQQMTYFGRSHFNASNLAFWQLGVALGPQMMLFSTWGRSIHPNRLLIVEAAVRHLLRPQNLTRIIQDPICGEFLCFVGLDMK